MLAAEQNDLKPSIGCTIFLIARGVLLDDVGQVLCTPQFVSAPESARMFLIAAVLAPLLSILIFSGTPLRSMACWRRPETEPPCRRFGEPPVEAKALALAW